MLAIIGTAVFLLRTSTGQSRVGPVSVVWGEVRGLDYWLRRCEQGDVFIEIDGVKYFNVTGQPPYCVYVPEARKLLFSVSVPGNEEDPTLCLYDVIDRRIDRVHTYRKFGHLIAGPPMQLLSGEPPFEERVDRATDREIEILSINGSKRMRFVIDLKSLSVNQLVN